MDSFNKRRPRKYNINSLHFILFIHFDSYFDMMELAAVQFYSLLMSDVEQLCANPRGTCKRGDAEPNMLCLAFRLSKLDKDWAKFIPFR